MPKIQSGTTTELPMNNGEVASLIQMLDQIMGDASARPWASQDNITEDDVGIMLQNWTAYKSTYEKVKGNPVTYSPNTDETEAHVPEPEELDVPENALVAMWVRAMMRHRMQLRNGESKGQATGINPDEARHLDKDIAKIDVYIADGQAMLDAGIRIYTPDRDTQSPSGNEPGVPKKK